MKENSVLIIVEHFLSSEGRSYFDEWLEEVYKTLQKFEGYRSIRRIYDTGNNERTLLHLRFSELDLLRSWSSSEEHDEMLDSIRPDQLEKQKSQV